MHEIRNFFWYLWRDHEGKRLTVRESWLLATFIRRKGVWKS